jgi:hypothetical protein
MVLRWWLEHIVGKCVHGRVMPERSGKTPKALSGVERFQDELWALRGPESAGKPIAPAREPTLRYVFPALPTIERHISWVDGERAGRAAGDADALYRPSSPLALVLGTTHLCVSGQLDTRDYRVQFLFPIQRDWAHPSSTLPVSYTVEEARRHMAISERSPPRMKSYSRNPLVLLCRT